MRAHTVNETLKFERGLNPKVALGLGPDPRDPAKFLPFVIKTMPRIFTDGKIPEDIIDSRGQYIPNSYVPMISEYLEELLRSLNINPKEAGAHYDYIDTTRILGYNIWDYLRSELRMAGFYDPLFADYEKFRDNHPGSKIF